MVKIPYQRLLIIACKRMATILLSLWIIHYLATTKNAGLDIIEPGFWQWFGNLLQGRLAPDAGTDDLVRDLATGGMNSLKIVALIYSTTLFASCTLGIFLFRQRRLRIMPHLVVLFSAVTLLPPFTVYYLALKFDLLSFTMLGQGGELTLTFGDWWAPVLFFALFNSYFAAYAVAVRDVLEETLSRLFVRFYQARGAWFTELLNMIRINWLLPTLTVFLYFFPFVLAESVIFELVFRITGLGSMLWYASDYDMSLQAVRVFTPKLLALTATFIVVVHLAEGASALVDKVMSSR